MTGNRNRNESLTVRRLIPASPRRLFRAWTDPDEFREWWGPPGVRCLSYRIELKVGGRYRIENELPDGTKLEITGCFEAIEEPHLLIYTWAVAEQDQGNERVSIKFEPHKIGTELVVTHERISTTKLRDQHQQGWLGCLDGLMRYAS